MFWRTLASITCGMLVVFSGRAQQTEAANPLGRSEQAIAEGRELYNRTCTVCHGLNGTAGDRAPALAGGRPYVIRTDAAIFEAIRSGISGSAMPASNLRPLEVWSIVAYIRSLRATASDAFVAGDPSHGAHVFWNNGGCGSCHMIRGRGGISGPDLSNIAGERTLSAIRDSLTKRKLEIPSGYRPVEVITVDGRTLTGIAKNEDNFSLQLLDSQDRLQLLTSDEYVEVKYGKESLMPGNYEKLLAPADFQDLLAFLSRQVVHKLERRRRSEEDQ